MLDDLDRLDRLVILEDSVELVERRVGLPTELLGGAAVDKDIVYEMKWPFAAFLFELSIHRLVNTWVGFAHVQKVRGKTILKHRHIVLREDMLPMQFVVVAQEE